MRSLKHLNKYLLKYKWRLLLGGVFITVANLFAIFPAQIIRHAFDTIGNSLFTYHMFTGFELQTLIEVHLKEVLIFFGLLIIVFALIKGLFTFFMRQTIIVVSRLIEYDLKNEIFTHYQDLSPSFYKRNNTGDLMARISEDVTRVRMYLGPAIMYSVNVTVLFILVIFTMFSVNVELTIYVLTPLPILSVAIYYVSNIINKKSEVVQRQLSRLSTLAQETFSGIRVLKAYNREKTTLDEYERQSIDYKGKSLELARVNALFFPLMILLIGLSTILTIYIGGQQAIAGAITTGNIAEFVFYVNMLTWPVASLGWVTSLVQRAAASQERINEFLTTKPEITNPTHNKNEIFGEITFDNVQFTYPDSGIQALKGISFHIPAGGTLAIIGRTGAGKSTIAALVSRLYDSTQGSILIDGKDIRTLNLYSLRDNIGYVPQEVFLFSDTIAGNISFGIKDIEDKSNGRELIEEAAKNADIYSNIMEFPQKFETRVGERGVTLSGGQKQRISIARAIIKKPKILIFDDCLSAVDTETEEKILRNLKKIMQNKTTLIISHRVSSVKDADKIMVLDDGKIIEEGNHQELLKKKGEYFELHRKQLLEEMKTDITTI